MRLRPLVLALSLALAASSTAWAQMQLTSTASAGPALETMSMGGGRSLTTRGLASGLKLGEGTILHAGVFADIGWDSNVFYGTSGSDTTSPVLHVTPRLELTNAERDGSIPSGTYYDLVASLDYRKYLSNNGDVTKQDALNPTVSGTAEFSSGQALSLSLSETFSRYQQAPYSVGDPITSDDNLASASLTFAPGGGRLRVMLRYSNLIYKFEGQYDSGSYMGNEGVLDVSWRWLPKTSLYLKVAQGALTYFMRGTSNSSSYPLRTLLGIRGLLTEKFGVNIAAGYSNAFYSSGESPSGFGNVGIVTEVNYTMSLLSRAGIGYHHDFVNSPFLGGYYNMDAIYGTYQQMVASRLVTYLYGRFENRRFGTANAINANTGRVAIDPATNLPVNYDRVDNSVIAGAAVDYVIANVIMLGASYSLSLNRTLTNTPDIPGVDIQPIKIDYTKHVLLFRLGAVY
jgi:hypothetical protein